MPTFRCIKQVSLCEHPYSLLYKTFKPWFRFTTLQDHFPHFEQSQMVRWNGYRIFPRKKKKKKKNPRDPQQQHIFVSHLTRPEPEPTMVSWLCDSETIILTICLQGRQKCNICMKSDRPLLKIVWASYNLLYCMNRRVVHIKKLYATSSYNLKGCVNGPLFKVIQLRYKPLFLNASDKVSHARWLCRQYRGRELSRSPATKPFNWSFEIWPIHFLTNVFFALKGAHFCIFISSMK